MDAIGLINILAGGVGYFILAGGMDKHIGQVIYEKFFFSSNNREVKNG